MARSICEYVLPAIGYGNTIGRDRPRIFNKQVI